MEQEKDATANDIAAKAKALGVREDKAVAVMVQVLFDADIMKQLPKKHHLFIKFLRSEKAQKAFLGGIERIVGVLHPDLLPKVALILKAAYDEDLLDEEVILAWGEKISKRYVPKDVAKKIRTQAKPFLDWLKNASEEDSDEDSEDEESE